MADPDLVATVSSGGTILSNILSVTCRRDFTDGISYAELSMGEVPKSAQLVPGNPITVNLAGQKFLTGFVCRRAVAYDKTSHQVLISARSKVGDVHDSSIKVQPGTLDGSNFGQVARMVCQPHGVGYVEKNPPPSASKPFASLRLQPGETGGELLSRLAAARGLFISDDADGNVVAGCVDPSAAVAAELVEGRNILSFSGVMDDQRAFGIFSTISQTPSPGQAEPTRWYSATASAAGIRPNRYRLSIAEHPLDADELKARNNFEVVNANFETIQASPTVVGWLMENGELWDVGLNVSLRSPAFYAAGALPSLAIQSVTFLQDPEGTRTTLNLVKSEYLTSLPSKGVQDLGGEVGAGTTDSQPDAPDWSGGT